MQINYVNRKPIGVAGLITPVEHAVHARELEARPRARHREHGRAEAGRVHAALRVACGRASSRRPALPKGVFNLVNGLGEEAGDALVKHPDVPLISLHRREPRPGRSIFGNAAPFLKGLSMELGGKSPADRVRRRGPRGGDRRDALRGVLAQRRALHRRLPDPGRAVHLRRVRRALRGRQAEHVVVGLPHDPATEVGALVHPEHFAKVMCYVEIGKREGRLRRRRRPARRLRRPATSSHRPSSPTSQPDARIFQEEIFGPVVAITPFDTDDGGARPRQRRASTGSPPTSGPTT